MEMKQLQKELELKIQQQRHKLEKEDMNLFTTLKGSVN